MKKEWIASTCLKADAPREAIEEALKDDVFRSLEIVPWKDFPLKTQTCWSLLHGPDAFFLSFTVEEPTVRAVCTRPQDPVCEDSCAEWFFDWGAGFYLNVEINPIGTCTLERGGGRSNRENLLLLGAPGFRSWGDQGDQAFEERPSQSPWRAWAVVPYALVPISREMLLKEGLKANFFKCGEKLSEPHYNAWTPMSSAQPDFHRPQDFAPLRFSE